VVETIGRIDWLIITLSGSEGAGPIADLDLGMLRRVLDAKFWGVNGVSPGFVDTPWWSGLPDDTRQAYFAQAAQVLLTRRIATADDTEHRVHPDAGFHQHLVLLDQDLASTPCDLSPAADRTDPG